MMVKICGITNRDDAMAAVEFGASAIGFNFYRESPRYISHTGAAMITEKIPAEVLKVGIFVNENPETIARCVMDAGLDVVQLYGTSEACGIRIWRACRADTLVSAFLEEEGVEAVVLDTPSDDLYGGTGKTWDWSSARGVWNKVIIAGGLNADNVRRAIEEAQPWGVDACSSVEKTPGFKDHEKMKKFVEAALGL